jgi:cytochrome c oxidase subunit 3
MARMPQADDSGVGLLDPPASDAARRRGTGRREPPRRGDDDDDGSGGGDGWRPNEDEGGGDGPRRRPLSIAQFGFGLTLIGVAGVFFVFFAGYVALRFASPTWPPPGAPRPPLGLWVSTALLVAASLCLSRASRACAGAAVRAERRWLALAALNGLGFVGAQCATWYTLRARGHTAELNAYTSVFYALTGVHVLHVVGGLVLLGVVLRAAWRGRSGGGSDGERGEWTGLCAWYWHALGLVWALILALLYL